MPRELSVPAIQDALRTDIKANGDYVRSILRDALAEVAKGECPDAINTFGAYDELIINRCGTCIVCVAKKQV